MCADSSSPSTDPEEGEDFVGAESGARGQRRDYSGPYRGRYTSCPAARGRQLAGLRGLRYAKQHRPVTREGSNPVDESHPLQARAGPMTVGKALFPVSGQFLPISTSNPSASVPRQFR